MSNRTSEQIAYDNDQADAIKCLFKAVLYRAAMDAIYFRSSNHTSRVEKDRAIAWLKGEAGYHDLREVCELAGVSVDRIVKVSRKLFANGGFSLKYRLDYKEIIYDERKRAGAL